MSEEKQCSSTNFNHCPTFCHCSRFKFMGEGLNWLNLVYIQHPCYRRYLRMDFSNSRIKELGACGFFGSCCQELNLSGQMGMVRQGKEKRSFWQTTQKNFWITLFRGWEAEKFIPRPPAPIVWDSPKCINAPHFWSFFGLQTDELPLWGNWRSCGWETGASTTGPATECEHASF